MSAFEFGSIEQLMRDDNSVTDEEGSDESDTDELIAGIRFNSTDALEEEDHDDEVVNKLLMKAERLQLNANKVAATVTDNLNDNATRINQEKAAATATVDEDEVYDSSDDDNEDESILKNFVADPFYDDKMDAQDQRWVEKSLMPGAKQAASQQAQQQGEHEQQNEQGLPGIVLSCPCCFTTLSHHSQQHDTFHHQYRAVYVVNCVLKTGETLVVDNEDEDEEGEELVPVHCASCGAGVGVHSPADGVFEFFEVIPSG